MLGEGRSLQLGGGARTMKRPKCHSPGDVGRRIFGGARFSKVFVFFSKVFRGVFFSQHLKFQKFSKVFFRFSKFPSFFNEFLFGFTKSPLFANMCFPFAEKQTQLCV